ncbi:DUF563 domain-containing protein [Acetobacter persici]|uniref:glycosyltransferase family 61 protein n=1 Tax=Acetobacter persici TaxID=1076596 RepID=UPI0036DF643F
MQNRKEQALFLRTHYDVRNVIKKFCSQYDIVEIPDLAEAEKYPQARVLLSALVLTHSEDMEAARSFVIKASKLCPMAIFFEPASESRSYLAQLGYKSFHENYPVNRMLGHINVSFFREFSLSHGISRIDRFGVNPTYDLRAMWIVPEDCTGSVSFSEMDKRPNLLFDETLFEFSAFVVKGFDSPARSLEDDLELVESRTIQPQARAGEFFLNDFYLPKDVGREVYTTPDDISSLVGPRKIYSPILIEDEDDRNHLERNEVQVKWREMFDAPWKKVSVYELPDCVIGHSGFIFSEKKPIAGSDYLIPFMHTSLYQPIWEGMQKPHIEHHIKGISILGFNCLSYNYYHFISEALNSVSLCLDVSEHKEVTVITRKLNSYEKDYFGFLLRDRQDVRIVELDQGEYIRADTLLYCNSLLGRPDFLKDWVLPHPALVAERIKFQEKILTNSGIAKETRNDRLVYVSRQDTSARKILNEAELIERLRSLGFDILVATGTTIYDQIRTFREAKIVVAGHGAGVSNMLYARENAVLIELIQASYLNVGPMRLAQLAGSRYYSMLFFEDGVEGGWYVDIDRLERALKMFL